MIAKTVADHILIERIESLPNKAKCAFARVAANDYDAFAAMSDVIEIDNELFGKTGWNSDTGEVFYRSDAMFARAF